MKNILRIWRVVPTSKTGVQAPYFYVETLEEKQEKAKLSAISAGKQRSRLSDFPEWEMKVSKTSLRKDKSGKYTTYHQ
jgi:hypothetical protein